MSTDSSEQLPRKKPSVMWWLGGVFLLLLAGFLYQLLGPNPPIIVSKETTYITAPLRPNGLPDYGKYLLETSRQGVTPENNAALLFLQATGPSNMDQQEFQAVCREVGLKQIPSQEDVMQPVYGQQNRQHLEAWLKEIGEPTTDEDAADKIIDAALEHSWKSANVPALADWVRQNEKPLDLLVDASRKPNYYLPSPSLLDGGGGSLNTMSLTGVQAMRNAARALTCRAMWHLGENRPGKAWQDILAVHRLGRLTGQGRSLVEQLVAIAIVGIAADATVTLLDEGHLTSDQTQQIERDLATLSRPSCMADSFDGLERMTFLEAFFWAKKDGFGTLISASEAEPQTGRFRILNAVSIDWNVALREGNRWYDRISAAARIPNWADRQKAFANINYDIQIAQSAMRQPGSWVGGLFSRPKRSELIAAVVVGMFIPATTAATNAEDRNSTQLQLMQLASAIADYRAKHGHYPDRLEELIPDIIAQLPVDLYHNKPFVFRRDGDGYLLYSTGENGQDDGGSNEQMQILAGHSLDDLPDDERQAKAKEIPVGADDIAIRMPRPAFEWPKPAAK